MEPPTRLYNSNAGEPRKRPARPTNVEREERSHAEPDATQATTSARRAAAPSARSVRVAPAAAGPARSPATPARPRARRAAATERAATPARTDTLVEMAQPDLVAPAMGAVAEPEESEANEAEADEAVPALATTAPTLVAEVGPSVGIDDFEDIFSRFQTPLTNFVYRLVGNREQAYDLTQDVFVKAYRALSSGTTIQAAALSSWLYRIASNTATDALRRRRLISWLPLSLFNEDRGVGAGMPGADLPNQQQPLSEEALTGAAGSFVNNSYDGGRFEQRVADREIVQTVLRRLPPKYATCLLLYEHEGFSCAEIAEVLQVSPSAVKMRLMRARERFITLYKLETGAQE